ncbi:hypothetical protein A2415_03405 [candidate division WWE3 bacterium RIFOXYC1_FULL_39_7]|uniref:Uncharacterized protein n=2 Tax=Katanobacteria TaxID=422282 RepID=A0A1F4X9L0_UNCKA|nr:MAG: hypothetical protein A2415_03405 [candidate division WWE3 bacterium RIFOXYC1_FULL_39_7]OGC78354.1 MAG: hypothetical protein A2619_04990 [candidate division WWE3 bacterium RIFOXYD1_FULL_39_9]
MKQLQKVIITIIVLVLLALDYAALDDITTGNEINFYLEYSILLVSLAIYLILIYKFIKHRLGK